MIDIREMSVLVADDMENMYTSIRSIMRVLKFGRKFQYAPDGEEALKALQTGEFDLALLDNNMPGISGLELLGLIRNDKNLRDMPIIMITGHAEQEFITNAAESDIDAYLLKPITVNLLKEKVPQVIEQANNPSAMARFLKSACAHAEAGDIEAAIADAQRALEANPKSTRPLRDLGEYYQRQGSSGEAEQCLLKAVQMNSIDVIALNRLGDLYLEQEDMDRALKCFSKAVSISPRHYTRGLKLGKILVQKHMADKARPVFAKVFEIARDPVAVKEEVARFCMEEGAQTYAARLLKGIVDQSPNRADVLYRLALLTENRDEALQYLLEAEHVDPAHIDIKLQIARIHIAQGMLIRAEAPLKAVLKIDPDHGEARELLRQCI